MDAGFRAAMIALYCFIAFFTSLFINDSGELSNFKHIFVSVFWLPVLVICGIEGFLGTHYLNDWIFHSNKK